VSQAAESSGPCGPLLLFGRLLACDASLCWEGVRHPCLARCALPTRSLPLPLPCRDRTTCPAPRFPSPSRAQLEPATPEGPLVLGLTVDSTRVERSNFSPFLDALAVPVEQLVGGAARSAPRREAGRGSSLAMQGENIQALGITRPAVHVAGLWVDMAPLMPVPQHRPALPRTAAYPAPAARLSACAAPARRASRMR
jgi:hypothetical protein